MVFIRRQVGQRYQTFGRDLHALSENAESFDARNDGRHPLPDFVRHEIQELEFDQVTFSVSSSFLQITAMLAKHRQSVVIGIRFLAVDQVTDHSMNDQVWIAANWRRKVAVVFAVERVVSYLLGSIGRLLHAAQDGVMNRVPLGHVLGFLDHTFDFKAALERVSFDAKLIDKLREFLNFGFRRLRVNSPHVEQFQIRHSLGDGFVASEHELFDDLMALGVVDRVGARNLAVLIEVNFDFRKNQVNRAAVHSPLAKFHRQGVHVTNELEHFGGKLIFPRFIVFQILVNLFVSEAMGRLDRAPMEFGVDRHALVAELDQCRHAVTDTIGLQAGEVVGNDLREHRDDAIGKVNTCAPRVGFVIEVRVERDKVRDVGDVDAKFPMSILKPL